MPNTTFDIKDKHGRYVTIITSQRKLKSVLDSDTRDLIDIASDRSYFELEVMKHLISQNFKKRGITDTASRSGAAPVYSMVNDHNSAKFPFNSYLEAINALNKSGMIGYLGKTYRVLADNKSNPYSGQINVDKPGFKEAMEMATDLDTNPELVMSIVNRFTPKPDSVATFNFKYSPAILDLTLDMGIVDAAAIKYEEQVIPIEGPLFAKVRPYLQMKIQEFASKK